MRSVLVVCRLHKKLQTTPSSLRWLVLHGGNAMWSYKYFVSTCLLFTCSPPVFHAEVSWEVSVPRAVGSRCVISTCQSWVLHAERRKRYSGRCDAMQTSDRNLVIVHESQPLKPLALAGQKLRCSASPPVSSHAYRSNLDVCGQESRLSYRSCGGLGL